MQYMLLIYDEEAKWAEMSDQEKGKIFSEYGAFSAGIRASNQFVAGDALELTDTATTVRVRDGKMARVHGPFAETKEALGGFYIVEAKDLDEACALAAKIPTARSGSIEVRPIMKTGG